MSKSQVFVAHSFWVICRNVSRTFVELCMETPYWCTVLVHQYGHGKRQKHLEFTFSTKALSFHSKTSIRADRINISSDTWNGYTAENQQERLFFNETAFQFWCHALWQLGSSNCCIFEMKNTTEMETCTKIHFLFIVNLVNIRIRKTSLFWLYNLMTSLWKPSILVRLFYCDCG